MLQGLKQIHDQQRHDLSFFHHKNMAFMSGGEEITVWRFCLAWCKRQRLHYKARRSFHNLHQSLIGFVKISGHHLNTGPPKLPAGNNKDTLTNYILKYSSLSMSRKSISNCFKGISDFYDSSNK
jgi:hypothetical protein